MQDPERVVHAAVPIIGMAGRMLMGGQKRELFVTRKNHVASVFEKTLRHSTTMAVYLLHRDRCWFFHVGADGVPLLGSQQTTRTE
jgi:hypothetical protein